ncbi:MAG TPA: hypothetical protein VLN26_06635 [Gaiellaceae bacterium]|nr:hypothetical protein [Gaiellaceae bacterium]
MLEQLGFELFAPHAAWRHWDGGVDALHILWENDVSPLRSRQSRHLRSRAGSAEPTPAAFRLVAGTHFHAVPLERAPRLRAGRLAPSVAQCHVTRAYAPGPSRADALDRELWLAAVDHEALLGDLRGKARRAARSLDVLHRPRAALEELARRTRWQPRPGSTGWLEVTGYLAAAAGAYDVARPRLQRLLRELEPAEAPRAQRVRSALAMLPTA